MSNIEKLHPAREADEVLKCALGVYDDCIVIGWDKDGELDARATLGLSPAGVLWLMEQFKAKLIGGDYSP